MAASAVFAETLPDAAIRARGLGKDYGELRAVDEIDLEVRSGEFFGFLGPNGAGKTTTIHMLTTLLAPSRGEATVAGYDVAAEPIAVRRQIGLVFQETTLDLDLSAEENLRFAARLYGLSPTETKQRIDDVLDLFDLQERRRDRVRAFSGGMRRALDLARGLLHRPAVLFLDEPTLGLDPTHRRRIWRYLDRLTAAEGTTLFLTTHYLDEADGCDRVAIIDHGRLIAQGTPAELKRSLGRETIELSAEEVDDGLLGEVRARAGVEPKRTSRGIVLTVDSAEQVLPKLLSMVGERVRTVSVRPPTLEDVFIALTGGSQDGDAEGGSR